jgi:hypothetical protein
VGLRDKGVGGKRQKVSWKKASNFAQHTMLGLQCTYGKKENRKRKEKKETSWEIEFAEDELSDREECALSKSCA